jgi:UPF0755 protein
MVVVVSAVLATLGWNWANDVLALNKPAVEAVITLPESIFTKETINYEDESLDGGVRLTTKEVVKADMTYVGELLKENGLIQYPFLLEFFAVFTHKDYELAAGTYELNSEMDYSALLTNMGPKSVAKPEVEVTIPEGYNIDQIFQLLEDKGVATVEDLRDMAANHDYKFEWLVPLEIPLGDYHRLEGFLFPDTYKFYVGHDPLYAINKMLQGFDKKIMKYLESINANEKYDLYDLVTIASLIEKETDGTDQVLISSVIYNRLYRWGDTPSFLNIDAAIIYALGEHKEELTLDDLQIDSPYNTYLYTGLTPGPISNPGLYSLNAALDPDETDYYYYAMDPDTGAHHFSRSESEHNRFLDSLEDD